MEEILENFPVYVRENFSGYLRALYIQSVGFYRDPEGRTLANRVIKTRLLLGMALLIVFPSLAALTKVSLFESEYFVFLSLGFVVAAVVAAIVTYTLNAFAVISVFVMVASTPVAVISYLIYRLYNDLDLVQILPRTVFMHIIVAAIISVPLSLLSIAFTFWCIARAQPYLSWSVAGFAKGVMAPLVNFKILPFLGAVFLWSIAPFMGQYISDGDFWARTIGVLWVVIAMPAMLWVFLESILTGFDRLAKVMRTRNQNVFGEDGFAEPYEASIKMGMTSYE
jgi:hypothetical protein